MDGGAAEDLTLALFQRQSGEILRRKAPQNDAWSKISARCRGREQQNAISNLGDNTVGSPVNGWQAREREIQELYAVSWLPGCDQISAFAVLIAYMDESGTHDPTGGQRGSEVAAIAGYVSTYKGWVRFQREWRKVLRHFGVRVFHMVDYAQGVGEFKNWSKPKRDAFLLALTAVIDDHKLFGLGGVISVKDYDSVLPKPVKAEAKHPYYFCFALLMRTLRQFAASLPAGRIDFIFYRKRKYQGTIEEMFDGLKANNADHANRLGEVNFRAKDVFTPLQAADYFVYEVRRYAADRFYGSSRPTRKSMEALMKDKDLIVGFWDADDLRVYAQSRMEYFARQG